MITVNCMLSWPSAATLNPMATFALFLRSCLRNVLRQRRRTAIALSAIAFGVVAMLISGGFIGWVLDEMRELTIRTYVGHLQIARPTFWSQGASDPFGHLIQRSPLLVERLKSAPDVLTVAPRLSFAGLASKDEITISFLAEGVDPVAEARFGRALIFMPGLGEGLGPDDGAVGAEPTAVIGRGLAANLGATLGDKIVLLVTTPSGSVNAVEVRIKGVFHTVSKAFDDGTLRLPLATAQKLLRTGGVQSWTVLTTSTTTAANLLSSVRTAALNDGLDVRLWTDLADTFLKTEALFIRQLGFIAVVLALLIVLGISNTLTMSVMERTGEIGTAMALGASRQRILGQFILEGAVLGLAGATMGTVLGLLLASILSAVGIPLPPPPGLDTPIIAAIRVGPGLAVAAFVTAALSATLAGLYPAWRASRLVIVDSLRQVRL
jgi:putative ABC transport system permease protein